MRLLRPPFACVAALMAALAQPAMLLADDGTPVPGPLHISLRTALAVAVMVAIGILVGWLLARNDERGPRLW
jgi:ABC-type sulfate transport system permease component